MIYLAQRIVCWYVGNTCLRQLYTHIRIHTAHVYKHISVIIIIIKLIHLERVFRIVHWYRIQWFIGYEFLGSYCFNPLCGNILGNFSPSLSLSFFPTWIYNNCTPEPRTQIPLTHIHNVFSDDICWITQPDEWEFA